VLARVILSDFDVIERLIGPQHLVAQRVRLGGDYGLNGKHGGRHFFTTEGANDFAETRGST
jgi:hypothetical protein